MQVTGISPEDEWSRHAHRAAPLPAAV